MDAEFDESWCLGPTLSMVGQIKFLFKLNYKSGFMNPAIR